MKKNILIISLLILFLSANAQVNVKVGLAGSAAIGDMSDYYDGGPGVDVNVSYLIAHKIGVGISTGFQHFFAKDWDGCDDIDFNIIPIHLSVAYFLGDRKFKPYFGGEFGLNFSELSYFYTYDYYDAFRDTWYSADEDLEYSYPRFGAAPVIGFQLSFSKLLAFDLSTKLNLVSGVDEVNSEKQSATYFSLYLGLAFRF
jgi:hypothetical protein